MGIVWIFDNVSLSVRESRLGIHSYILVFSREMLDLLIIFLGLHKASKEFKI